MDRDHKDKIVDRLMELANEGLYMGLAAWFGVCYANRHSDCIWGRGSLLWLILVVAFFAWTKSRPQKRFVPEGIRFPLSTLRRVAKNHDAYRADAVWGLVNDAAEDLHKAVVKEYPDSIWPK